MADLDPAAYGLGGIVLMAALAWLGRKVESASSRAVAAQGAAAEEWQELATFQRERADVAERRTRELEDELTRAEEAHAREVAGLEQRLEDAGLPVRRRHIDRREPPTTPVGATP